MKRTTVTITLVIFFALGLHGCGGDAPTEPQHIVPEPDERLVAYVVALQDVRDRILPAIGPGAATDALGSALLGVEGALSQPAAPLDTALARANAAAMQLGADSTLLPDLDVVLLVLEQIRITAHSPAEPTGHTATVDPRRPQP